MGLPGVEVVVTDLRRLPDGAYELSLKTIDFKGAVLSRRTAVYDRVARDVDDGCRGEARDPVDHLAPDPGLQEVGDGDVVVGHRRGHRARQRRPGGQGRQRPARRRDGGQPRLLHRVDAGDGVFITAEGLLMYLQPEHPLALITECAARFPAGR